MSNYDKRSGQRDIATSSKAESLAELTSGAGVEIEPVTNLDGLELEKFMQEPVVVYVHKTKEKGALEIITPGVNGKNMPIVRGVATTVKRKYVESLIMSHEVNYEQRINPLSPDQFEMVKVATPSYPFDVMKDSEQGYAWKDRLEESLARQV